MWRSVTDRSKAPDAAAAATNNSGGSMDQLQPARRRMPLIYRGQSTQQLSVKFNIKKLLSSFRH